MKVTRREFLRESARACAGYALGTAAFVAGVQRFSLINAFAQGSDYRALVWAECAPLSSLSFIS